MIHVTQKLDFAQSPLGVNFIIKSICYLLYRHMLIRLWVQSRASQKKKKIITATTWTEEAAKRIENFGYQTMPYAPFPMGMIGGLYLEVTSKTFPKMLYWMNRPPWLSVAGIWSIGGSGGGGCGSASDITSSAGWSPSTISVCQLQKDTSEKGETKTEKENYKTCSVSISVIYTSAFFHS